MVVVAIMGILATLAVVGYQRYIRSAKTGEAVQILGMIKSGQEAFKAETFRYLDVSDSSLSNLYPQGDREIGTDKYAWEGGLPDFARTNFQTLGVSSSAPVYYGYSCIAGSATDSMPEKLGVDDFDAPSWPAPGGPWYVAVAVADLNGDGVQSAYATSSLTAEIVSLREGD